MTEEKKKEEIMAEEIEQEAVATAELEVEPEEIVPAKFAKHIDKQSDGKKRMFKNRRPEKRPMQSEFEQSIIDIARVTRVMAGGKRMRFRACVAIGNKHGRVGIGLAKGADVTLAVNKAVNQAKKQMIDVQIPNGTIAHSIKQKLGAAEILLQPTKQGRGIICGGVARIIMEMAGVQNVTGKILGTNNKVSNAKCVMKALQNLKTVKIKEDKKEGKQHNGKSETKPEVAKDNNEAK